MNRNNGVEEDEHMEEQLDTLLAEKKALPVYRETAWSNMSKELRFNYKQEFVHHRKARLIEAVQSGMKSGNDNERVLAIQFLPLLCVTSEEDRDEFYKSVSTSLVNLIKNDTTPEPVVVAAIRGLGLACFLDNSEEAVKEITEFYSSLFTGNHSPAVLNEAVTQWSLLVSILSHEEVATLLHSHLAHVIDLLRTPNYELRESVGEALALIFEIMRVVEGEDFDINDFDAYEGVDVSEMLDLLQEYAKDSSRGAKREKSKQRASFRDILDSIQEGQFPSESINIQFQSFAFSDWGKLIQLNGLRDLLGEGFQTHFQNNPTIVHILDVVFDKEKIKVRLSSTEKRFLMSPNSPMAKERSKERNKSRDQTRRGVGHYDD